MVGDAEDRKRWERYYAAVRQANEAEAKAIASRTPQYQRSQYMDRARELRSYAYSLVV